MSFRRPAYRIVIEHEGKAYWPFWPFKLGRVVLDLHHGFKVKVDQVDGSGHALSGSPITVQGYVSTDGETITTNVDFNQGSRLKRITKRG